MGGQGGVTAPEGRAAWLPALPSRPAGWGGGCLPPPPSPQLARMRAGKQHLVLSDVPFLQDNLSLPGRQFSLVVAQRSQLL